MPTKSKRMDKLYADMGPYVNLVTVKEASRFLRVNVQRVRQFIAAGRLQGRKMAGRWLIDRNSLREFAELNRKTGRPRDGEVEDRASAVQKYLERAGSR